jgi:hypothetical protein
MSINYIIHHFTRQYIPEDNSELWIYISTIYYWQQSVLQVTFPNISLLLLPNNNSSGEEHIDNK